MFLLLSPVVACGGSSSAFGPLYPDNRPADVQRVFDDAESPTTTDTPVFVGLRASTPPRLFAFDPQSSSLLWEVEVESRATPQLAGDLVITSERRGIVARSIRSGEVEFETNDQALHLIGADGEGRDAALVLSTGGGVGARTRILLIRNGRIRHTLRLDLAAGVPAVRGGHAYIPWATQNLSVLSIGSGRELARLRVGQTVISHAIRQGNDVYFGHQGIMHFGPEATEGTPEAVGLFSPDIGELPGHPRFLRDAYSPPPLANSALHKIRLEWLPSHEGRQAGLEGPTYYVFYRLVFALDAVTGLPHWVHVHDADIVGAQASRHGLFVLDADGNAALIQNGQALWSESTGEAVLVGQIAVQTWLPAGAGSPRPGVPIADQLRIAAADNDARLVPGRTLAVEYLANLGHARATENLIAICDTRSAPAPVTAAACEALTSREQGAAALLATLGRHSDYLNRTEPPPIAPLAQAAAAMNEGQAIPLLVAHLVDPATPATDLPALLTALGSLGDRLAATPIAEFLQLYHAESDPDLLPALIAAGDALITLLGPEAREHLERTTADPLTYAPLGGHLDSVLLDLSTQESQESQESQDGSESADAESADSEAVELPPQDGDPADIEWPRYITAAIVTRVLAPFEEELHTCLQNAQGRPRAARLIIVLEANGTVDLITTTNTQVQTCIQPIIRGADFPGNTLGRRQQVIYTLRR